MVNKLTLEYLAQILRKNQVCYGIGGSVLLKELGFDVIVNDIDIVIDPKDIKIVDTILKEYKDRFQKPKDIKFDTLYFAEFSINQTDIDIMAGFKVNYETKWYTFPFDKETPTTSIANVDYMLLEDWYVIYYLLDRNIKVSLIETYFFQTKLIDKARVSNLVKLALPADLKMRLIKLLNI